MLHWAEAPSPVDRARLLFYTSRDGTDATELGYRKLVEPCLATCTRHQRTGALQVEPPRSLADDGAAEGSTIGRFLAHAAGVEPAVLLSVSHGLGVREGGWLSAEDQRTLQGALLLPGHERLTAAEVAERHGLGLHRVAITVGPRVARVYVGGARPAPRPGLSG